ncbi:hypothetical protein BATDEDRAFT_36210 [Batrachochytrium dendrobatidis JAM81]|uniref:Uncharacterized protein n=1 Tax=Batrachochytrium dendrobatidis (strain JAM81 / FGSC 10211) TaxID=684364 RepID=F4PDJ9_BATDJ|nr:uncharacterized protein BATDEDRAFT_36210 [Batrachochytrium dendrobatidis JAM81]EGF76691.1 hypothetical protein BATDEDRAFT_36210 [Batrachochytrium dendrobatidis JAM81]KAK5666861.1 hypothetical protein QVD99_006494 [Batrachochytrium dendrobatidis]|eukprot:XP_006682659.1 hypothetical protein BATDEDRAFT_36210 [Batrachochytrium dendrobatidis JAM81]
MMQTDGMGPNISTDEDHFFQSDLSLKQQLARKEKQIQFGSKGFPLQLPSKVLAMELVQCLDQDTSNQDIKEGEREWIPKGVCAYVGESGHVARKINLQSGAMIRVFKGHSGPVTSLAILYDTKGKDSILFTGSWDKTIRKWNTENANQLFCISFHNDFVKSVCLFGDVLYSASTDKTICQWDGNTGKHVKTMRGHTRGVETILVTQDGSTLFSASSDGSIRKWDTATGKEVAVLNGHDTSVYGLALSEDESELWSASADKTARRWDLETNACTATFEHPDFVRSVLIVEDHGIVITGCRDENMRMWNTATDKCVKTIEAHTGEVSSIKYTGKHTILSGSLDNTIRFWSITQELSQELLTKHSNKTVKTASLTQASKERVESTALISEQEERELAELMENEEK